jgi:hypothetical protein
VGITAGVVVGPGVVGIGEPAGVVGVPLPAGGSAPGAADGGAPGLALPAGGVAPTPGVVAVGVFDGVEGMIGAADDPARPEPGSSASEL